jgi:unsaturated chondroitin disaccharide hydrolase
VAANRVRYEAAARATLDALGSAGYRASESSPSILSHGTLHWRMPLGRDVGLSFGDYFYLEALQRLRRMPESGRPLFVRRIKASKGVPQRVLDGNANTRWSVKGKQWIRFDLGTRKHMRAVRLCAADGTSRTARFKFYVSNDMKHWKLVGAARSSGETAQGETYAFAPARARFLRVSCNGTTRGSIVRISEARVF